MGSLDIFDSCGCSIARSFSLNGSGRLQSLGSSLNVRRSSPASGNTAQFPRKRSVRALTPFVNTLDQLILRVSCPAGRRRDIGEIALLDESLDTQTARRTEPYRHPP